MLELEQLQSARPGAGRPPGTGQITEATDFLVIPASGRRAMVDQLCDELEAADAAGRYQNFFPNRCHRHPTHPDRNRSMDAPERQPRLARRQTDARSAGHRP